MNITQKGYNFQLKNSNEEIFLKILSYYELENINIDRSKNGDINNYYLDYIGKNRIVLLKEKKNDEFKTYPEIQKERKIFEKSEYKQTTLNKLTEELENKFNLEYARSKVGKIAGDKEIEYIANIIESLNKEHQDDPYIKNLKEEFSDYFTNKEKYIKTNLSQTDLYLYFKEKSPGVYKRLFNTKPSILKSFIKSFRNYFKGKRNFSNKKLCVIDVEIISKMRLDVIDNNGNNLLEKEYSYSRLMKNSGIKAKEEYLNYDTSIYEFKLPDHKWDINNKEFIQSHVIRFEFEKKGFFNNLIKNPYKNMLITDIDLALKGNKHFSFDI
jgi:hypothetical protein